MLPQIELKDSEVPAEESRSVCPECLKVIDCQILFRENKVYLRKYCENHGLFEILVYSDIEDYLRAAKYNKPGSKPSHYQGSIAKGCPEDCGLCAAHLQHTCVGVIEITGICNLNCPVCFADAHNSFTLPFEKVKEMIDLYVKCESKPEVLQISGGEPTLRPDIFEILKYAGQKGILHPVLNTNGLRLADRDFAERISNTIAGDISKKIGYGDDELAAVPEGANLGLGCGNPVALASLKEGDIVLDLGSGAGFDCFLAANKVGRKGKVIGVDMTPEMVQKARENARAGNYQNVEFRLGEIENIPVADNSVDVVVSIAWFLNLHNFL